MQARSRIKAWQSERAYTVSVTENDDIYADVQEWLLDRIPPDQRRGLLAATKRGGHSRSYNSGECEPESSSTRRVARSVFLAYDGAKTQTVSIDGHNVTVAITKREYGNQDSHMWGEPARITFTAEDLPGREAAVQFLQQVADAYEKRRKGASLYVATKWGDWQRANDFPARPIGSVVLAGTQREDLISDLQRFIQDEEVYTRLGLPWHRGYLFHGPAGSGKTSIAKALAGYLGLDMYYMPLGDLASDTDLARLITNLEPRSVLLLEDIDIAHAAKTRDDKDKGVSLSGLLQALDGVLTPWGLVTIMTSNNPEALDDALVRVGRVDRTVLIDYLDDDQLHRLLATIVGDVSPDGLPSVEGAKITPAEVIELAKPHLRDPSAALDAVEAGLLDRVVVTTSRA